MKTSTTSVSALLITVFSLTATATDIEVNASPGAMSEVPDQTFDILNRLEPVAYIGGTYFTPGEVKDDPNTEVTQVQSYLSAPITGGGEEGGWQYFVGLSLIENEFRVENSRSGEDSKQRLYDITLPFTFYKQADAETAYVAYIAPGFRSSLEYVGDEDLGGDVVFQVIKTSGVHSYQYGGGVIAAFGEIQLVPIVSYSYQPDKHLNITLGLPTFVDYAVDENQSYFARLTPNGGQWHAYDSNNKNNSFDYKQEGYRFGAGGEWKLWGPLYLELEAGVQFSQKITYIERGNKQTIKFDPSDYVNASFNIYFD